MAVFRVDYQQLARDRLREARLLLKAKMYAGAYHIAGFAVECALKACIAKAVARHQFPDKRVAEKAWTHSATDLLKVAGLETVLTADKAANRALGVNWAIVVKWHPDTRYNLSVSRTDAVGLYAAIASTKHGVLRWIRKHW